MKIHLHDTVKVIAGKDKGKIGTVKRILRAEGRVLVEGVNMVTKHIKAKEGKPGQRVETEAALHISNIAAVCPKTKKATRIGYVFTETGDKQRIAKVSGEIIPNAKSKK